MQIYKGEQCLYSTLSSEIPLDIHTLSKNKTKAKIIPLRSKQYIVVAGHLPEQYDEYIIAYCKDITDLTRQWKNQILYLFAASTIFAGILSIILAALLEYLFEPLEQISVASKKIANGKYQEKLDVKGEGEIAEVVLSFNTMADKIREQMQALQNNAEEKQRLIDNLSHELRTPLTAIYGYAEYIQKTRLDEEDKYESTQFILEESRRLRSISEILLDLAALREEAKLEMEPIDVGQLFERVYQTESMKVKDKKVQFKYESKIKELYGNEDLIESMLINLLDNAIKACEPLKGKVTLNAYQEDHHLIVEVKDNGKGMTNDQVSHITEAFYRVDKARSRSEGGNGLGLALCEQIAKKHHAQLMIESRLGQGTSIKVIFNE